LSAASGRKVACKSKRWPGRKRAITGAACPLLNNSLGGVRRVTAGAAWAHSAVKAAKVAKAGRYVFIKKTCMVEIQKGKEGVKGCSATV
jgi:hypothetical protein